ncbi:Calcipressin-domain-containing protein [Pleurostoma richardsiae]|uniref:Calcipressin-domain-containing protein n=1 Tax=Pleurostoma richardsiae TaxID=41990 RepID=A0AA38VQR1_9PEZI|nr:Calcipressin-domain-containing protein [Pleurostoma richardsiae]
MDASASPQDTRPSPPSRASSRASKKSLTLDLSNLPPLSPPTPPSNTLLFTNLQDLDVFRADNLQTIRELIEATAPIHSWSPLKSFRRIVVSFPTEQDAIRVRSVWDGEAIMGERCRVYFGQPTPVGPDSERDRHLALPDPGKLFFISPPPSPPHDWEMHLEGPPNKEVHAEDLADALAKLHHHQRPAFAENSPVSPTGEAFGNGGSGRGSRQRSRSSTLIYQPSDHGSSPGLPAIAVEDMTDEPEDMSPFEEPRPIAAHTARPPVELMNCS